MKNLMVFLLAVAMLPAFCFSKQPITKKSEKELVWEKAFASRIQVIEKMHGIKFDPDWKPTLTFKIPNDTPPQLRMRFGAQYFPETQSFVVSPTYESGDIDFSLIDHELGHALADQVNRRFGNKAWPNTEDFERLDWDERIGINIISEGIGAYFQHQGLAPHLNDGFSGDEWLPNGLVAILWQILRQSRDSFYRGGRWLVAPIIKKFGERGILYLVTHRLRFDDYDIRTAGREYQRLSLERLSSDTAVQ